MGNTFGATDSLKGIAICAVLITHFLNQNIKGNFLGFGSLFVGLFFLVSGYGIYHSLERSQHASSGGVKRILIFYVNRLLRIFPLFLLAYTLQCYLFDIPFVSWTLLGIHAVGHFWFIPAIIQCYVLSPLLFLLINKHRFLALNVLLVGFIAANFLLTSEILPHSLSSKFKFVHQHWRDVYFLSPFLFGIGMMLPLYLSSWKEVPSFERKYLFVQFVALTLLMMIVFKYQSSNDYLYVLFTATICPLLLLLASSVYLLANRISFSLLAWIGRSSLTIYLFHIIVYRAINHIFGYGKNALPEILITLAVLPLYFSICTVVEGWNKRIYEKLRVG